MHVDLSDCWAVVTTINPPTRDTQEILSIFEGRAVVVGDRKTPDEWSGTEHFLPFSQHSPLERSLPVDHYSRKNLGYLEAIKLGARGIYDTDDDNFPLFTHSDSHAVVVPEAIESQNGWFNPYPLFGATEIWPRGFPLELVRERPSHRMVKSEFEVGIWQLLADQEPDLDAVGRMLKGSFHELKDSSPIAVAPGTYSPINSQSTFFVQPLFPLLYLPVTVTFRYTDILRGYVANAIAWAHGFLLGFRGPYVRQDRNPHDVLDDFRQEVPMYLSAREVIDRLGRLDLGQRPVEDDVVLCYEALAADGVVQERELEVLHEWLEGIRSARK